jgi:hypothetical protein
LAGRDNSEVPGRAIIIAQSKHCSSEPCITNLEPDKGIARPVPYIPLVGSVWK